jgi:hypothetical protein
MANRKVAPNSQTASRPATPEAALYSTGVPGVPLPNADGRALVARIATTMLNKKIAPGRGCGMHGGLGLGGAQLSDL